MSLIPAGAGGHPPQAERDGDRHEQLGAGAQAERPALDDLRVVVGEAEQRARHGRPVDADRAPVVVAEDQERDRDGGEDDDPAHRGRARLLVVALGPLLADELAELAVAQEADEARRQEDADEQGGHPRDEDLAHQAASASRACATTSRPTPRDALTSTVSPSRSRPGTSAAAARGVAGVLGGPAEAVAHVTREVADGDEQVDAGGARVRADLAVPAALLGPELEHVAEHGDAAPGRGHAEVVECGAHRHRVGVVAVVHDDDPARELDPLPAHVRQRHVDLALGLDADRARRGQRGERIQTHVRRGEGQCQARRQLGDVAARPEGHGRHVLAAVGVEQRLAMGQHRGGARAQPGDELGLGGGDRLHAAQQLEVDGPDVDDHADVGLGDPRQLGDLAAAAHRHLEHEHLGPGRRAEDGERQADLRVEVLGGGDDAPVRREHPGEQVLRGGLARRPGDPDDLRAQAPAPGGGEAAERAERVLGGEQRARLRAARRVGVARRDEHAPRPGGQRLRREAPAVDVAAVQADEQVAGAGLARVDDDALGARGVRGRGDEARTGGLGDALRRPVAHAAPPGRR